MTKRIQNLERLCLKMQARYGAEDAMVTDLAQELAKLKLQLKQNAQPLPGFQHSRTVRPKAEFELH